MIYLSLSVNSPLFSLIRWSQVKYHIYPYVIHAKLKYGNLLYLSKVSANCQLSDQLQINHGVGLGQIKFMLAK